MNDAKENSQYEEVFYIVPRHIRKLPGITLAYLDVYETIFQFLNKGKPCFLSNPAIKERTGIKSDDTLSNAFQFFENNKILERRTIKGRRYFVQAVQMVEIEEGVSVSRGGG